MINIVKNLCLIPLVLIGLFVSTEFVQAQFGSCSEYGFGAYESGGYCRCMSGYVMGEGVLGGSYCISEDQACKDQYGYNAKSNYLGSCECRSGYEFENTYSGKQCVSSDSVCQDNYGYNARHNSLSDSCECGIGYVFGKDSIGRTQCISDDQACRDQLGMHSKATYGDKCECSYGYVIDGGKCTNGDQVCRNDHGLYASYNNSISRCECDDDYVFDDSNQCVKKHNSAYFTLLDISEDGDELLIESQYDYQKYIIEFGTGCWDYAIETYERSSLVVNMGTDFSIDMFDTLVLPNHDQNCSILSVDWTSDYTFDDEVEETYVYTSPVQEYVPSPTPTYTPEPAPVADTYNEPETIDEDVIDVVANGVNDTEGEEIIEQQLPKETVNPTKEEPVSEQPPRFKEGLISKFINFIKSLF